MLTAAVPAMLVATADDDDVTQVPLVAKLKADCDDDFMTINLEVASIICCTPFARIGCLVGSVEAIALPRLVFLLSLRRCS